MEAVLTALTGQTVVETTTVSVTKKVCCAEAGQLKTVKAHAVMVDVLVASTVEVVNSISDTPTVVVGRGISITGQTVVVKTNVSVVRKVLCDLAGQFVTSGGQAMTVAVRVVKMVEVLRRIVGRPGAIADSKVGEVISEEGETDEKGMVEEDDADGVEDVITALADVNTVLAIKDSVLEAESPVL